MPRTCSRSTTLRSRTGWPASSTRSGRAIPRRRFPISRVCGKALLLRPAEDRRADSRGVVADGEEVEVLGADHPLLDQALAHPVDEPAPVVAADKDHGEVAALVRLAQR